MNQPRGWYCRCLGQKAVRKVTITREGERIQPWRVEKKVNVDWFTM
jgi:hypothetical protein